MRTCPTLNVTPLFQLLGCAVPCSLGSVTSSRSVTTRDHLFPVALSTPSSDGLLGLRLAEGLDLAGAARELDVIALPPERKRALDRLERAQRIELAGGRLKIPKTQWLFADGIISELI